jgi:hypothetical protein
MHNHHKLERESVDSEGSVRVLSHLGLDHGKENLYTVLDIGKKANDFSARITFSYAPEGLGRTLSRTFVVKRSDKPFGMPSSWGAQHESGHKETKTG